MTPTDLRSALARLHISQSEAARLLGVEVRTVQRWIVGDRAIPHTAARLLHAIERDATLPDELRSMRQ